MVQEALGEHARDPRGDGDTDALVQIFLLLPPFLLYTVAFGGTIIPKLNLVMNLFCRQYYEDLTRHDPGAIPNPISFEGGDNEQCDSPEVQKLYTTFILMASVLGGLLTAITSPKLGALSDRYGRKAIICLTTTGMLIGESLTIVAATYPESFNPYWLLVGYAVDGLAGSFIAGMAVCHSYAADCTPPSRRNVAFAYFHSCLFLGIGVGPLIFGFVVQLTGSLLIIFYVALAFHLIFVFALLFVIPESLSKRRQMEAREKYEIRRRHAGFEGGGPLQGLYSFFEPLRILWPTGPGSSPALRRNLVILASIDFITFGVAMGAMAIIVGYIKSTFHWDAAEQSYYMSAVNLLRVACLVIVLPLVTRIVRGPQSSTKPQPQSGSDLLDLSVIRFSIFLDVLGFLGYTIARTGGLFTVAGLLSSVGGMGGPTLQSALTKHVPADRTGELLGATGLLHALARVISPLIFSAIYYNTVDNYKQAVFLCLAVTFIVAEVMSWLVRPGVFFEEKYDEEEREGLRSGEQD